jgi:hypothetical protein
MFRSGFIFTIIASTLLVSCIGDSRSNGDPDVIYFDYMVTGDEESKRIISKFQYWLGGKVHGKPLLLESPAGVTMDGEALNPDSATFNGIYYEVIYESEGFAGEHIIEFTDPQGKKYKTTFPFPVFSLQNELPGVIDRDSLLIDLAGIDSTEKVLVILTDTSFYGKGVEKLVPVETGRIVISPEELEDLKNGPVHLEILWEMEKRLQGGEKRPGRIYTSYRIQRELLLQDDAEN